VSRSTSPSPSEAVLTPGGAAEIAVVGGSGFTALFEEGTAVEVEVDTRYGPPSGPISLGRIDERRVAFLERHGPGHRLAPHQVNYRANLAALASLGVRQVLAPTAVGSLRAELAPGNFVVPDQLVDRTWGRAATFVEVGAVHHLSFAEPYCPRLSGALAGAGSDVRRGGTVVVVEGPRFSTRAESASFRASGWDLVNMTQMPEAALAAELGCCYAALAIVTDYDAGLEDDPAVEPVTAEEVFRVLGQSVERARRQLARVIRALPAQPGCGCAERAIPGIRDALTRSTTRD